MSDRLDERRAKLCVPGPEREKVLQTLERDLGLRFRNRGFLNLAFFHRSCQGDVDASVGTLSNERLEFLGDAILGMVVGEYLFLSLPERSEGDLAKIKSHVVSEDSLARLARTMGIPAVLILGKGEERTGGRDKKAILADALEAFIGALYLDAGLDAVRAFILEHWQPLVQEVLENRHSRDYKTLLQEYCQKELKTAPRYVCLERSGPDHAKVFLMEVRCGDQSFGPARGGNKKEAEQGAARMACAVLLGLADSAS